MPTRSTDMNASQALRRVRAGGAVVPPKVAASPHKSNSLPPSFGPTYNKRPLVRTSHHSFRMIYTPNGYSVNTVH